MSVHQLHQFDQGSVDGFLDYQSSTKTVVLGPTVKETVFNFYVEGRPEKTFILIVSETPANFIKWRLWLNNFSLTKEFKPNDSANLEGRSLHMHLFDITHIVAKGKNEFMITYSGVRPLSIHLINVVSIFKEEGFKTFYSLRAGLALLRPGEEIALEGSGKNYLVVKGGGKNRLRIVNGREIEETELGYECEEYEYTSHGVLRLINEISGKNALVFLHYLTSTISPKMDFDVELKLQGNTLEVRIINTGEVTLDKVSLNVMINGVIVNFKLLGSLKPSESISHVVQLPPNKKGNVLVRAVGIKAGIRKVVDRNLEVK